mmetsp:Transcript_58613/g.137242  ORF Transcript_58613/g.137242 Transcript_58613/m.137242 type:complete len:263 (-) Transcript_58613:216-1004(-)
MLRTPMDEQHKQPPQDFLTGSGHRLSRRPPHCQRQHPPLAPHAVLHPPHQRAQHCRLHPAHHCQQPVPHQQPLAAPSRRLVPASLLPVQHLVHHPPLFPALPSLQQPRRRRPPTLPRFPAHLHLRRPQPPASLGHQRPPAPVHQRRVAPRRLHRHLSLPRPARQLPLHPLLLRSRPHRHLFHSRAARQVHPQHLQLQARFPQVCRPHPRPALQRLLCHQQVHQQAPPHHRRVRHRSQVPARPAAPHARPPQHLQVLRLQLHH